MKMLKLINNFYLSTYLVIRVGCYAI